MGQFLNKETGGQDLSDTEFTKSYSRQRNIGTSVGKQINETA